MLALLSVTQLFSYTEPHKVLFGVEDEAFKNAEAGVPDISRSSFFPEEAQGFPLRIRFAGERIPLESKDVFLRLERTLRKHYAQLDRNLALLEGNPRTMAVIDDCLQAHGIPSDFRYLPLIESRLNPGLSPRGAGGYWQLMPATARSLGLHVDEERDERNDLRKSTEAACRYLRSLYRELGSWTLAAAAYNVGQGALKKAMESQETESYYFLDLNAETESYLYRLVAMKELLSRPNRYHQLFGRNAPDS